jgi:peptidoglycan/LPS O-acetylase OafA/YrhL
LTIFFVISGFVISNLLYSELIRTRTINIREFYIRRLKRLTPALSLAVTVTILSNYWIQKIDVQANTFKTAASSILLFANVTISRVTGNYFDYPASTNALLHTWSLSVEEQFYLVFPLLLFIISTFALKRISLLRTIVIIISMVSIFSFFLTLANPYIKSSAFSQATGFYSPLSRIWEFGLGVLAMGIANSSKFFKGKNESNQILRYSALGIVIVAPFLIVETTHFQSIILLFPLISLSWLLGNPLPIRSNGNISRIEFFGVWIGDRSYSIYLWHWPILVFTAILFSKNILVSIFQSLVILVLAYFSYKYIENPIRRMNRNLKTFWPLLMSLVLFPLIMSIYFLNSNNSKLEYLYSHDNLATYRGDVGQNRFHEYLEETYFPCLPVQIRNAAPKFNKFVQCKQSLKFTPINAAFIGDSHSEHLFPGFANRFPMINFVYYDTRGLPLFGTKENNQIFEYVGNSKSINSVFLNSYWANRGIPVSELRQIISFFSQSGKNIFISDDVPDFTKNAFTCKYSKVKNDSECSENVDAAGIEERESALKVLQMEFPNLHLLKTYDVFCDRDRCSMIKGRTLFYRDGHHLNLKGSTFLANELFKNDPFFKNWAQKVQTTNSPPNSASSDPTPSQPWLQTRF